MKKVWKSMDYSLLLPLAILCVLGVIMVYSSSSIVAITRHEKPADFFFNKQLLALAIGTVGLGIIVAIPYHVWRKRIVLLLMMTGSIGLLALALLIGKKVNGAQAWVLGIQPAEFVKIAIIIVLARFFARRQETDTSVWKGSAGTIMFIGLILFLIRKQNDLGTVLLIIGIVGIMFLCSGIPINKWIKRLALSTIVWIPLLYLVGNYALKPYQKARFAVFLNPFDDPQGDGFQLVNSFIGIASGGLNGRGLSNSIQKFGYLPEPHTDFIMAIISEELGFVGVAIVLISLLLIIIRALRIAQKCKDPFGSLIAIGIASLFGVQTFVNIGGMSGLMPLTGVPLPFVSYGGSSLMANLFAMGILLNLGSYVKRQEKQQKEIYEKKQQGEPHLVVVK
ncbi:FtsW/RodA/SpoVE family cell cycle protein [Bacillus pseudomycoides]|uniref:FtsW/RodA/SpoVE family cell cycle protein n=1 Tax=Bacillus TaxID=1386 RepID=UPI00037FA5F2|nr:MULTISPECIES: FtsW/RodA/SpoVE family cell cycle protein [Bacillus]AIK35897.1 cell cycle family protein [Bacillus pseudomycoides]AJI19897.1 cell cycle family protein [Bacillus pseudomycoides]MBJ8026756.1 FtsW/RodA/SpoVE family cell cycle protein [Bacillus cereus group sp. N21]MCX2825448.1 FtsW/RodA/SpoVE family cell cycle protein [Bacillus sp. DHT2]MDR4918438.1 FtsW/RodA/SpoVE family cell cycle protein [Bacillus pseudomycoides]